jgi:GMP synthase (glutamine-hydrolysing)
MLAPSRGLLRSDSREGVCVKSVVAIQHVHFDGLGTFEPVLREAGYGVTYVDVDRDNLAMLDPL